MARLLILFTLCMLPASARAQAPAERNADMLAELERTHARSRQEVDLAIRTADVMSEVVGVGISPVFGLAAFGMWDWYHGHSVAWYTHPAFTFPVLALLLLIALKDVFGVPLGPGKQFADSGEVMASKVGGALGLITTMAYCADTMGEPAGQAIAMVNEAILPTAYAADAAISTGGLPGTLGFVVASILGGAC